MVSCYYHDIAICADDTTLYSKCDQAADLWQQLKFASELETDLQDTFLWPMILVALSLELTDILLYFFFL